MKSRFSNHFWGVLKHSKQGMIFLQVLLLAFGPTLSYAGNEEATQVKANRVATVSDANDLINSPESNAASSERIDRQVARTKASGRDPYMALMDPYYTVGQRVIVKEANGSTKSFEKGDPNLNFPTAPVAYDLQKDIQVSVEGNILNLTWSTLHGAPLPEGRTYIDQFEIPGIQSVIKDSTHVHILLKNGDTLSILMSHSWLFQPTLVADGGPLVVPFVGAAPQSSVDAEGHIPQKMEIIFYDSRLKNHLNFDSKISPETQLHLRYGDILYVIKEGSSFNVLDILRYKDLFDALGTHFYTMVKRDELLSGNVDPLETITQLTQENLALLANAEPSPSRDAMLQMTGGTDILKTLGQTSGLSLFAPSKAQDWINNPLEGVRFSSSKLRTVAAFLGTAKFVLQDNEKRSTYDHGLEDAAISANNIVVSEPRERRVSNLFNRAKTKIKSTHWTRLARSTLGTAEYVGKKLKWTIPVAATALAVGLYKDGPHSSAFIDGFTQLAHAFWNGALFILPSSMAETQHFLGEIRTFKVHAWNFGRFGQGPEILYSVKFILLSLVNGLAFLVVPKAIFAPMDTKILGRKTDRSTWVGLQVIYTIALRFVSRFYQSLTSVNAAMIDKVMGADKNGQTLSDKVEAARLGVRPGVYNDQKAASLTSGRLQEKIHQAELVSARSTFALIIAELVEKKRVPLNTPLSYDGLRDALGEEGFEIFLKRSAILSARVKVETLRLVQDSNRNLTPEEITKVEESLTQQFRKDSVLIKLTDPLSESETREFEDIIVNDTSKRMWAKVMGQNSLYYRFRRGEVPMTVIRESIGWNSFVDFMVVMPLTIASPDYSNIKDSKMLAASDQFPITGVGGFTNPYIQADQFLNVAAWMQQAPQDVMIWSRSEAGRLSDAYMNPQLLPNTAKSDVRRILAQARPSTLSETEAAYKKGFRGLNRWYGVEKLGSRITVSELRSLKITAILATFTTFLGYLFYENASNFFGPDWSLSVQGIFHGSLHTVSAIAGLTYLSMKRVIFTMVWAYLGYRIFWSWHNLGIREADGYVAERSNHFADLIARMADGIVMAQSDSEIERREGLNLVRINADRICSIYAANDTELPESLTTLKQVNTSKLSDEELVKKAEELAHYAVVTPPFAAVGNRAAIVVSTVQMGILTTIIPFFISGAAWNLAKVLPLWSIASMSIGLYGFGLFNKAVGGAARAYFGYSRGLDQLKRAIADSDSKTLEGRSRLFKAVRDVQDLYKHFESGIPAKVVDLDRLNRDRTDLDQVAKDVYEFMLKAPPQVGHNPGDYIIRRAIEKHGGEAPEHIKKEGPPSVAKSIAILCARPLKDLGARLKNEMQKGLKRVFQ